MATKYLDPKADLTFKKVFGEHPDLVISLLNALLPFKSKEEEIEDVVYLTPEMVPATPLRKNSIVDVRCRDANGRQFIVEMQMIWSPEFMQRVMFNASKAYVSQLDRNEDYHLLEPVYSLNLVNDVFIKGKEYKDEYYHYYRMVHEKHTDRVIDGLHLIFVELPKFRPHTFEEKKMQVLWLRYLTEIEENTKSIPQELLDNPNINKALTVVEESAYTPEQLLGYDKFWDIIRTEKTYYGSALRRGLAEGHAKGRAEGRAEGIAEGRAKGIEEGRAKGIEEGRAKGIAEGRAEGIEEGRAEERAKVVLNMRSMGLSDEMIAQATGLTLEEIRKIDK